MEWKYGSSHFPLTPVLLLPREMATLTDVLSIPEDYIAASFSTRERRIGGKKTAKRPLGRPRKRLLELSNGQAEADKPENIQAAPVFADGEESSAKSIRCQYTAKQKQRVVLYARHHGVCPAERKFSIP